MILIFDVKENEWTYNRQLIYTVNISTNIHNEHIKTKYIPSYNFENEGKILKKSRSGNCRS